MRNGLVGMAFVGTALFIGWASAEGHGWLAIGALLGLAFSIGSMIPRG